MTYSIVARDPETGEFGVAVQSRYFAPERSSLGRARGGGGGHWQVGMVDATGTIAAHTGSRCVAAAGHAGGDGVSTQANMMERGTVWDAMLESYGGSRGSLAERLLRALEAAQSEGGDIRGQQSAALIIVGGSREDPPWLRTVDLRVDDHPGPVAEIRRQFGIHSAFRHMERATESFARGDSQAAAADMDEAYRLAPNDDQVAFRAGRHAHGLGARGGGPPGTRASPAGEPPVAGLPQAIRRGRVRSERPDLPGRDDAPLIRVTWTRSSR